MTDLSERAMLATLSISTYGGMMHDKEVTEEVNASFKAEKQAGRYNKRLVHTKFFVDVAGAASVARRTHKLLTLPWEDDGTRILTTAGYLNYTAKMKECRLKFETASAEFAKGLPEYIEEAKTRLGEMFNVADYPSEAELTDKFDFDVEIKQVPQSKDFRAHLSDDQVKTIIKDMDKRSNKRVETAMNDVFERVADLVRKMSEKLRDYTPASEGQKVKGKLHDSLVYNIHEIAEALPSLNITNDPRIEKLQEDLMKDLVEYGPQTLRGDAKIRAQTISKADKILKKVEAYMK